MKKIAKEICDKYFETDVEVIKTKKLNADSFAAYIHYELDGDRQHWIRICKETYQPDDQDIQPQVEIGKYNLAWGMMDDEIEEEELKK